MVYSADTYSNTIVQQEHIYPIIIDGNISYEGILKHRKYRCDSLSVGFYLP